MGYSSERGMGDKPAPAVISTVSAHKARWRWMGTLALCVCVLLGCRAVQPSPTPMSLASPTSPPIEVSTPRLTELVRAPDATPTVTSTPAPTATPLPTAIPTATYAPGTLPAVAQQAAENGDWEQAIALGQAAVAESDADERPDRQLSLARSLLEADRVQEAIALLGEVVSATTTVEVGAEAWGLLGSAYESRGEWQAAIDAYEAHLSRDTSAEPYVRWHIADCYAALDDTAQQAQELASIALDDLPTSTQAEILEELAEAQRALEEYDAALATYDTILALAKLADYRALLQYQRAQTLREADRADEAVDPLLSVVRERPASYAARLALPVLDELEAGDALDGLERGTILYYGGDYAAALQALESYIDAASGENLDRAHYLAGLCQTQLGEYQSAFAEYDAVIEDYPESAVLADAWEAKAEAAQAFGGDPSGLYLEFAVRYPDSARAGEFIWLAAQTFEEADNWNEAGTLYRRLRISYPQDTYASEAWFREGLAAYILGNTTTAYQVWSEALAASSEAGVRARLLTWLGKTAPTQAEALAHWQAAAEAAPQSYYGLRARDLAAGEEPILASDVAADLPTNGLQETDWEEIGAWIATWSPTSAAQSSVDQERLVQQAVTLLRLSWQHELWRTQAQDIFDLLREAAKERPADLLALARRAEEENLYSQVILCAERIITLGKAAQAAETPRALLALAYPTAYGDLVGAESALYAVDPLLFLALVRQESRFDARAVSYAGATGLTQVMPTTGTDIASRLGDDDYEYEMLYQPVVSVRYGVWYLSWLLDLCDRDWVAALISYNAGYGRLQQWTDNAAIADHDLLFETMPVEQPRVYVRRIYEQYAMYVALYRSP